MSNKPPRGLGFFLLLDDPTVAEALATTGPDFLVIDLEASDIQRPGVANILRAVRDVPVFARLESHSKSGIEHALDQGVAGVIVPRVDSVGEARAIAKARLYPPDGDRGVNPVRVSSYFRDLPGYFATARETSTCLVQVETAASVAAVNEILSVDGIDGVFIGTGDLAMSLGQPGNTTGQRMDDARAIVLEAARAAGKLCGAFAYSDEEARAYAREGFDLIAIDNDIKLLIAGAKDRLRAARSTPSA